MPTIPRLGMFGAAITPKTAIATLLLVHLIYGTTQAFAARPSRRMATPTSQRQDAVEFRIWVSGR